MAPKLYGWQHLTYLAIFFVILIAVVVLAKLFAKTEKQKTILIKVVAAVLLVCVVVNRISVAVQNKSADSFIPNSYCGTTSLVISLVVLCGKPNLKIYQFLWYMAFVGGLATMLYPDFLPQNVSFFYLPTISGLLHHSVLLILACLLIELGWFSPDIKLWWVFPLGMVTYTIWGLFLMDIFNWANAMEINGALIEGTPLNWWFILLVGTVLVCLFSICYQKIAQKIAGKKSKQA